MAAQSLVPRWTWQRFARSALSIAVAIVLGLLVDEVFQWLFRDMYPIWHIVLQFGVIIGVVALLSSVVPRLVSLDLVENIFFVSVFLGVQQHLMQETVARLDLIPRPRVSPHP